MSDEAMQHLEVSPQGMALAGKLAARVAQSGGAALIVDYGRDTPYGNSLQVQLRSLPHPRKLAGSVCRLSNSLDQLSSRPTSDPSVEDDQDLPD